MIYFDNAATTGKKPESVIKAVDYALINLSANPGRSGHILSVNASEMVYNTRKAAAEFFGSENPEGVIFTLNCTQSVNTVLKGVLNASDHIIISDMEHNAVMRPLNKMGVKYTAVKVSMTNDDETIENIKNAIRPDTKMIFVTAASNVLGKKMPLLSIGKLAKENGLLFGVDAAQGAGIMDIDMKKMNIDYLCVAAHKGLYAPMGTGILITRNDIKNTIIEGGTGTDSISLIQPDYMPEKFESGTVNLPGIAGINAGIKFVKNNKKAIVSNEQRIIQNLFSFLKNREDVILYTPNQSEEMYAPVISFNIAEVPSQTVAELLSKDNIAVRAGLHCAPCAHKKIGTENIGTVRISPGYFNTAKELNALKISIKKICENRKKYIE